MLSHIKYAHTAYNYACRYCGVAFNYTYAVDSHVDQFHK